MSRWTHIYGTIDVDTDIKNDKKIEKIVKDFLKGAPEITGSEGNANVFVNKLNGFNESELHYNKILGWREKHWQTRVIVTVAGDLRDKAEKETEEEVKSLLKFINKENWFIREAYIVLEDELLERSICIEAKTEYTMSKRKNGKSKKIITIKKHFMPKE